MKAHLAAKLAWSFPISLSNSSLGIKSLADTYTMHSFTSFSNLNVSSKVREKPSQILMNLAKKMINLLMLFSKFCIGLENQKCRLQIVIEV